MLLTVLVSIGRMAAGGPAPGIHGWALDLVRHIDFESLILRGMLPLLLFAGAFMLDLEALALEKLAVALLSVAGTAICFILVAALMALLAGPAIPWMQCLLFARSSHPLIPSPCWRCCAASAFPSPCRRNSPASRPSTTPSVQSSSSPSLMWHTPCALALAGGGTACGKSLRRCAGRPHRRLGHVPTHAPRQCLSGRHPLYHRSGRGRIRARRCTPPLRAA